MASFFGFIHAGRLTASGALYDIGFGTGWRWSVGYLLCAGFLIFMHMWVGSARGPMRQIAAPDSDG